MIEIRCDMWEYRVVPGRKLVHCITTNGFVKSNGWAVMGRGTAAQAVSMFPTLPSLLGVHIEDNGNVIATFTLLTSYTLKQYVILTFPVKHKWWEPANLELIAQSSEDLRGLALKNPNTTYLLPRPGCGNGQLKWEQVKPIVSRLSDNVLVVNR